jgi:hypothetical protein
MDRSCFRPARLDRTRSRAGKDSPAGPVAGKIRLAFVPQSTAAPVVARGCPFAKDSPSYSYHPLDLPVFGCPRCRTSRLL